jgi:hypothetical protein
MSYLDELLEAYRAGLTEPVVGSLDEARSALQTASTPGERGRGLAAVALWLARVRECSLTEPPPPSSSLDTA